MSGRNDWSQVEIERLIVLWSSGMVARLIGERLGRSKAAVVGKVDRLNLPNRPSPIRRRDASKPEKAAKVTLAALPSLSTSGKEDE